MDLRNSINAVQWDGKIVLAGMFIVGYYSLVLLMALRPLPATNAGLVRDALLTLGPPIGLIFGALFRFTGAEERRDAMRSSELHTAMQTPAAGPEASPRAIGRAVEAGAERGTRDGIEKGLEHERPERSSTLEGIRNNPPPPPIAADGARRDWLDEPQRSPTSDSQIATDLADPAAVPVMDGE